MTNYNVKCKIFQGFKGDLETEIENYLATVDSGKPIRSITVTKCGIDRLIIVIIHDE